MLENRDDFRLKESGGALSSSTSSPAVKILGSF
jgi:hypothetical protein